VCVSLATDPTLELECLETCQRRQHRHCVEAPDKCGECLSLFATDVDGVCQPQRHLRGGMYAQCTQTCIICSCVG